MRHSPPVSRPPRPDRPPSSPSPATKIGSALASLAICAWLLAHPSVAVAITAVLAAILAVALVSIAIVAGLFAAAIAIDRWRTDRQPVTGSVRTTDRPRSETADPTEADE